MVSIGYVSKLNRLKIWVEEKYRLRMKWRVLD